VPVWRVALATAATLVGGAVLLDRAQGAAAGVAVVTAATAASPGAAPSTSSTSAPSTSSAASSVAPTPSAPASTAAPAPVRASAVSGVSAPKVVAAPRRTPSLLVLGDSVPSGAACGCGGFGATLAKTTPARLTNIARGGLTSGDVLAQVRQPGIARALRQADIVTVTIGANDLNEASASDPSCANLSCYAYTLRHTAANIRAIAAVIDTWTGPDTTVVFTGYWNVFLDGDVAAAQGSTYVRTSTGVTKEFNAMVAQVAKQRHFAYADLYAAFKGNGSVDDTRLLASDGDHPNAAGHRLIASAITTSAHL
jgi:lysophospholipase L1-like esterase